MTSIIKIFTLLVCLSCTHVLAQGVNLGSSTSPAALAEKYAPLVYTDSTYATPALHTVHYELDSTSTEYIIHYHLEWADEIVPARYLDFLYRAIRRVKYGKDFADIEYLQIVVDRSSYKVLKALFETKEADKAYQDNSQKHLTLIAQRSPAGTTVTLHEKDSSKTLVDSYDLNYHLPNRTPLRSVTWNHLLELLNTPNDSLHLWQYKLIPLTKEEYSRKKYSKRSQAFYKE